MNPTYCLYDILSHLAAARETENRHDYKWRLEEAAGRLEDLAEFLRGNPGGGLQKEIHLPAPGMLPKVSVEPGLSLALCDGAGMKVVADR